MTTYQKLGTAIKLENILFGSWLCHTDSMSFFGAHVMIYCEQE